jgi:hypothetical protein
LIKSLKVHFNIFSTPFSIQGDQFVVSASGSGEMGLKKSLYSEKNRQQFLIVITTATQVGAKGLFTQNAIFMSHRVVRQRPTQLGLILIWLDAVARHTAT